MGSMLRIFHKGTPDPEWVVNEVKRQRELILNSWKQVVRDYTSSNEVTEQEKVKLDQATYWLFNKPSM